MTYVYRKSTSALAALMVTVAVLPGSAMAVSCTSVGGKSLNSIHIQDTPGLACPGGTCPTGDTLDPIAQLVAAGCDPPLTLRKDLGVDSRSDQGSTTPGGYCPPGVNGYVNPATGTGSPLCPSYNVNGNPTAIPNNGAGATAFSTGNAPGLPVTAGTNVLNAALNQPATPAAGLTSIPALPCGGAVGIANQVLNLGSPPDVQVGLSPSIDPTAVNIITNTLATGNCAGSTLALTDKEPSLILPAAAPGTTAVATPIVNGSVTPPAGSIISLPGGTPVLLGMVGQGTLSLPDGGTITDPNGNSVNFPQNTTLVSLGNGTLQYPNPDGTLATYVYNLNSPPITSGYDLPVTTTAIGIPQGATLPIDTGSSVISPTAVNSPNPI